MDKSWIHLSVRSSPQYLRGCGDFLEFAFSNNNGKSEILCPCKKCTNRHRRSRIDVLNHLICDGFNTDYEIWTKHGESISSSNVEENTENRATGFDDEMCDMLRDAFCHSREDEGDGETLGMDEETTNFYNLLNEAEKELYPGCKKFSTLSFTVRLLHLKVLYGWSDTSFNKLLQLLKEAFPEGETIPTSYYYAKKFFRSLGFNYQKIDACPKNCMLFWKEKEGLEACDVCGEDRYEQVEVNDDDGNTKRKCKARKKMRYFPLKPRLRRLFMSSKTASLMKWHAEERVDDGVMRHPADTPAWKSLDERHPDFAAETRNVRLGLSADGFVPFGTLGNTHSAWPVVLIPYNLPPWLCMKQSFYMLSLLVDGPQGPGLNIDVYLQPLIDELKDLWATGISAYDANHKAMFQLRATLLWTIHDFPAYAMISGWSTKGALACPTCNKDTDSRYLKGSMKLCYAGNRRFLDANHRFRRDVTNFYDKAETRPRPPLLSGEEIWKQVEHIENLFGSDDNRMKRKRTAISVNTPANIPTYSWKKKSIFFELPYWKGHLIRHNLDVMHIEKNVCDSILKTLLNMDGSKDGIKSREDLKHMGIRKSLHRVRCGNGQSLLPPAAYTMTNDEKTLFCQVLKSVKVPDSYSSNISKCVKVKERKVSGLKSHDYHVLMQQILPIAIRRALPKNVAKVLMDLCNYFRRLCSKELDKSELATIQEQIKVTLCQMEKIFPPSMFDVMVHLPIHLADEASVAGPVWTRWMYGVERYLCTLKQYVRQKNHPEGSIAEGYLAEECLTFCSRYLDDDVETKLNRPARYKEGGNGKQERFALSNTEKEQGHRYVLANTPSVEPFRDMHVQHLKDTSSRKLTRHALDKKHHAEFPDWLRNYVVQAPSDSNIPKEVKDLSRGPSRYAIKYSQGYTINGLKFHTMSHGAGKKSQNTGVTLRADTSSYSSVQDSRPLIGEVSYYGRLRDVIELRYSMELKFDLFRCDWVNPALGQKVDEYNFTLVNFRHLLYKNNLPSDEPFIFASQAEQVWYVPDPVDPDWNVAVKMTARGVYNVESTERTSALPICPQAEPYPCQHLNVPGEIGNGDDDIGSVRIDAPGIVVVDDDNDKDIDGVDDDHIDEIVEDNDDDDDGNDDDIEFEAYEDDDSNDEDEDEDEE